ncbi:PIG-L deacetylase family protein [Paenibacillus thiaminolyticus]|uniref:PIG-L family deacetylase n=1 Tax=Paenibacillus thiaminolyticus TaxID=49283 RepID=A0A3A3GPR6_PANTH|nr:PIG-L family deacetylase [Paenibacillus thiaminolyticus]RJG26171.1 PIG-L family deacetylase [Paenibacillus thiaminolyticus]
MTVQRTPKRHLVIAPHHDDEVIGCGGTIARALQLGDECRVVVVTRGDLSIPGMPAEEQVQLREQECGAAARVLGTEDVIYLREPDRSLLYSRRLVEELIRQLADYGPHYVYYPHGDEADRDHRVVNEVAREAIMLGQSAFYDMPRRIQRSLQYEVWTPLRSFQYSTDITAVMDMKLEALQRYGSQLARMRLLEGSRGLNAYRGMQVGVPFAEVFKMENM